MTIVCDSRPNITSTELKVVELMRQGMTNRDIALELCRSEFTVKTHVQRILAKTGARNRAQACAIAELRRPGANENIENTPNGVFA